MVWVHCSAAVGSPTRRSRTLCNVLREIKQKGEGGGLLPEGMSQRGSGDIYTALTNHLGNAAEITAGQRPGRRGSVRTSCRLKSARKRSKSSTR